MFVSRTTWCPSFFGTRTRLTVSSTKLLEAEPEDVGKVPRGGWRWWLIAVPTVSLGMGFWRWYEIRVNQQQIANDHLEHLHFEYKALNWEGAVGWNEGTSRDLGRYEATGREGCLGTLKSYQRSGMDLSFGTRVRKKNPNPGLQKGFKSNMIAFVGLMQTRNMKTLRLFNLTLGTPTAPLCFRGRLLKHRNSLFF